MIDFKNSQKSNLHGRAEQITPCLALLRHADATLDERWARCDVTSGQSCAVSVLFAHGDVTQLLSFDGCSVELEEEEAVVDRGDRHHVCEERIFKLLFQQSRIIPRR